MGDVRHGVDLFYFTEATAASTTARLFLIGLRAESLCLLIETHPVKTAGRNTSTRRAQALRNVFTFVGQVRDYNTVFVGLFVITGPKRWFRSPVALTGLCGE